MNKGKKIRFQVLTTGAMLLLKLQGFNYAHAAQISDQQIATAKPAEIKQDGKLAKTQPLPCLNRGYPISWVGKVHKSGKNGFNQITLAALLGDFEAQTTLARIYSEGK